MSVSKHDLLIDFMTFLLQSSSNTMPDIMEMEY